MSTDKHQTPQEMVEALCTLLSEAVHLVRQLPAELIPDDSEQQLSLYLTSLLLALNERGVGPDVKKDWITVQSEIQTVRDTISDVLALIADEGDQRGLLDLAWRDELVRIIIEQSEVFPLVNRGSIHRSLIEQWVARQLAQRKSS